MFDVAKHLLVVDIEGGAETGRREEDIRDAEFTRRVMRVAELDVDVLVCGAISRPLEDMLASRGVHVISQTCGPVEDVLRAFVSGQLTERTFLMPGCCGRRRRFRGGHR